MEIQLTIFDEEFKALTDTKKNALAVLLGVETPATPVVEEAPVAKTPAKKSRKKTTDSIAEEPPTAEPVAVSTNTTTTEETVVEVNEAEAPPTAPIADDTTAEPVPSTPTAPTEPVAPVLSKAEIATAAGKYITKDATNIPKLQAIMAEFGIKVITELPDAKLGEFADKLREVGVEI